MYKEITTQETVVKWIEDTFVTDYAKPDKQGRLWGLNALFPSILECRKFTTMAELIDDFNDKFETSDYSKRVVEWLNMNLKDDSEIKEKPMILTLEFWSVEEMIEKFKENF